VPPHLERNRLTEALDARRAEGQPVIDLTLSNPTRAQLDYPPDLLAPLADPRALIYDPQPFGLVDARRAVAREYERQGLDVSPDRIILTASTSDAYSLLFKLLADPGDEILVPRPSYPLFDHLTALEAVNARPYGLEYHGSWAIDFASVERALTSRTRAVLVVSPNNPTGSFITRDELDRLAAMCAVRDVAIIADEVFADYELEPGAARPDLLVRIQDAGEGKYSWWIDSPHMEFDFSKLKDEDSLSNLGDKDQRIKFVRSVFETFADEELNAIRIDSVEGGVGQIFAKTSAKFQSAYWQLFEKARQDLLAHILADSSNSKAIGKIRNYMFKWKPLRNALPGVAAELEAVGLERGPKFDKVVEDFFQAQLLGKARKPEDHAKVLRKLSGIKEPPKKIEEKKKPEKSKPEKTTKGAQAGNSAASPAKSFALPKQDAPAPPTKGQPSGSKSAPPAQKSTHAGSVKLKPRDKKK